MITHRHSGAIRLHFLVKQIGGFLLFWFVVWFLHLFVYDHKLEPASYLWLSFCIPTAAFLEKTARGAKRQSLCGLSKEQIANITQREIISALGLAFGAIVIMRDTAASRVFLGVYFTLYACWIKWLNRDGHRILIKHLYRNQEKTRTPAPKPPGDMSGSKQTTGLSHFFTRAVGSMARLQNGGISLPPELATQRGVLHTEKPSTI